MSICDFLFSADLCVPQIRPALDELVGLIGLPQPGPAAWVLYEDEGWDVVFALVSKAFPAAPTRLELIAPVGRSGPGPAVYAAQAPRPIRTHATVVAVPDLPDLVERVRRAGARHWLQPGGDQVTFDRLWMGAGVGDLADYDPAADGGFRFEFIPSNSSAFSPRLFETPQDEPRRGDVGFRRIRRRAFLVADLDATLRTLERVFGWTPAHPVRDEPSRGYRFAVMSLNHPHGAALMLVQPTDPDGPAGRAFAAQGPGPWAIFIAAFDLDATFADLEARGAAVRRLPAGAYEPEALVPELSPTLDAPIVITPDGLAV